MSSSVKIKVMDLVPFVLSCGTAKLMLDRPNDTPPRYLSARKSFQSAPNFSKVFTTMPREAELSLNERAFILQALQEKIRLDDRALNACRSLNITFGQDYGSVDIQLGKTR